VATALGRFDIYGKTTLDGFVQILEEFLEVLALGSASRDGRNFSPEAALFSFVHDDFEPHGFSFRLLGAESAQV
jgi:hypothetical protein